MKKKDLRKFLEEIQELKNLEEDQLLDLYIENNINYLFHTIETEELLDEYIKSIVYLYSLLSGVIQEEDYETAAQLKEAIEFEQQEFKRMVRLYHKPKKYKLEEVEEALELINQTTKKSFL